MYNDSDHIKNNKKLKVLAFDVGLKHLAYAILTTNMYIDNTNGKNDINNKNSKNNTNNNTISYELHNYGLINLNSTSVFEACGTMVEMFNDNGSIRNINNDNIDNIVIETQMVSKMKAIAIGIKVYFLRNNISKDKIINFSAANKLSVYDGSINEQDFHNSKFSSKNVYLNNKKLALLHVKKLFQQNIDCMRTLEKLEKEDTAYDVAEAIITACAFGKKKYDEIIKERDRENKKKSTKVRKTRMYE